MKSMAASVTVVSSEQISADAAFVCPIQTKRRRRVSPEAGRGIEILGHAIDYLMDEYLTGPGCISAGDDELEAVQMLMALNRQIYFSCPVVKTLKERWILFLQRFAAWLTRRVPE
jgi:hypothetical protein